LTHADPRGWDIEFDRIHRRIARLTSTDAPASQTTPARHAEDRLWVQQLVCGDGTAWTRFVQTHGRLVRSRVADVATSFGRAADEAAIDDATAEVFAALLSNDAAALRAFAGRSSLATYVAVIATRSATRGFARKRIPTANVDDSQLQQVGDSESRSDPLGSLIDDEQRRHVSDLLQELPQKQRDLVTMFHLQGKSYTEISDSLKIPIGSIGVTLRRAEEKLRQRMQS
tara:strand:+ start:12481 stop:13164 length:684 start_codon:yes stop_codon:yes gene_type:complete